MFALRKRFGPPVEVLTPEPPPPPSADTGGSAVANHDELLRSWMSLAEMQQRIIQALAGEITQTSGFVETEADALSRKFQTLAVSAQEQTTRVHSLTNLAQTVEFEDQHVSVENIGVLLEQTLSDVVGKILLLSKDSMSMVYALDSLSAHVQSVEGCMLRLDKINRTTNMLALNARIEAERAGVAGNAFRVVANEVRDLSRTTDELAATMNAELKLVRDGLAAGQQTLKRVATIDMSENILAKDRLDLLIGALAHRSVQLKATVDSAISEAETISGVVDGMVTGIQFQDRTKQRLEHVVDTLHVLSEAVQEIKSDTIDAAPQLALHEPADMAWVKKLLARYSMSEVRERFVAQVIDGNTTPWPEQAAAASEAASSGTIELF
jgi:methyl-accepting chemotaxis protein